MFHANAKDLLRGTQNPSRSTQEAPKGHPISLPTTTWAPLGVNSPLRGYHFGYVGHPVGDIGHCRGDIWVPWDTPLAPFGHTLEATSAILETCPQKCQNDHHF